MARVTPGARVVGSVMGRDLVGLRYLGPFHDLPAQQGLETRVAAWEDVGEDEGTGVVHIAPGCGEDDYDLSREHALPVLVPIDEDGVYLEGYGRLSGVPVSEAAPLVFEELRCEGMLFKLEDYQHRYPVCWRCGEELVFRLVDGWTPTSVAAPEHAARPELDGWLLSRLHVLLKAVKEALANLHTADAVREVEAFLDDLSNWYVRLSRRRFWRNEADEDKRSAYATLHETLVTVAKLLAPMLPFLSEAMYQNLARSVDDAAPESVHICDWPEADESLIDQRLMDETEAVMRVVRLGRSVRNDAGVKTRQPLAAAVISLSDPAEHAAVERNEQIILDELNVKSISFGTIPEGYALAEEGATVVGLDTALTEELLREGLVRDLVRHIQNLRKQHGFEVDDHIFVQYQAEGPMSRAIEVHSDYIRRETLADSLAPGAGDDLETVKIGGEPVGLTLAKA